MQPQTITDCTTDCNNEQILLYFIVKKDNILIIF